MMISPLDPRAVKLPPHNPDCEEAIIGCLLLRGSPEEKALAEVPFLRPDDFFRDANRWIYEGILALAHAGIGVDLVTVGHWLKENNKVEAIGGYAHLLRCLAQVETSYHLKCYAEIAHDLAERRRRITEAGRMAKEAWEGPPKADDLPIIPL